MVGAILGSLFHNFPPAKVYMGDSGAYMIGFVIAAVSLLNSEKGAILAVGATQFGSGIAHHRCGLCHSRRHSRVASVSSDREHIHHRLIRSGLSHRNTVLILYSVSLFALVGGLLAFSAQGRYCRCFWALPSSWYYLLCGPKITAHSLRFADESTVHVRTIGTQLF